MTSEFPTACDGGVVCKDLLEWPVLIVNKIKASVGLKINRNTSCNPKQLGYSLTMKTKYMTREQAVELAAEARQLAAGWVEYYQDHHGMKDE